MRSRFVSLVLVVLMLASFMPAQSVAPVHTSTAANFEVGRGINSDATFGLYNMVTETARHCAKYSHETGHLWWKHTAIDSTACAADPSTVFSVTKHHNLTVTAGRDFIKAQVSGTGTATNCAFIAVGNSAVTPAAADTTLTGEVATNGLGRASGTYASTGTGTFTLSKVFTATGAVTSVQAAAVFTAVSSGTMCFEVGSLGPVTLANTDTLTVTWSGTIT